MGNRMTKTKINRRDFLHSAAAATAGIAFSPMAVGQTDINKKPDDINVALLGAGLQGQVLMKTCLKIPGIRIKAVWQGGIAFEGANEAGQSVFMDSPIAEGGPKGPSPMQLVLIGLAGCTAMDVISILQKKRQDVVGFEVNVVGDRASDHPKYYTDIELEFVVRGRNINARAVERAIELSETKYCSASANLKPTSSIFTRYRIEEIE